MAAHQAAGTAVSFHAPIAPSIDSLPADLISLIISMLPVVPRIRVLSVLSRRWRKLVLQSIKRYDYFVNAAVTYGNLQFPCLETARIASWVLHFNMPPTLRSLVCQRNDHITLALSKKLEATAVHVEHVTLLLSADLPTYATKVVRNCSTLLKSLVISDENDVWNLMPTELSTLLELRFPALTKLCLESHRLLKQMPNHAINFISAHLSSLQLLALTYPTTLSRSSLAQSLRSISRHFLQTPPQQLVDLRLSVSCETREDAALVADLLRAAPSLKRIYLRIELREPHVAASLIEAASGRLVSLKLQHFYSLPFSDDALAALRLCTNLERLSLPQTNSVLDVLQPLELTRLRLLTPDPLPRDLHRFPLLEKLTYDAHTEMIGQEAHLPVMARLRELYFTIELDARGVFARTRSILLVAQNLRHISFTSHVYDVPTLEELEEFLRDTITLFTSVEELTVRNVGAKKDLRVLAKQYPWLLIHIHAPVVSK